MNNLPRGWIIMKLEDISLNIIGGDWGFVANSLMEDTTLAKVIRGTDFKKWGKERAQNAAMRLIKNQSLEKRNLHIGDIVIEVSGGGPDQPVGRTVIMDDEAFSLETLPFVCSNFFRKLSISKLINPFYVQYFLDNAYLLGMLNDMQSHTTNLRNLKVTEFLKINIPLPPYQEQCLIAEKIKATLKKIENVEIRLERIPVVLNSIIQLIFTAAVNGDLTEDWRRDNSNSEDAASLLRRITLNRSKKYDENLKQSENNDIAKPRILKSNFDIMDDIDEFHEIPKTWIWTRLLNIAEIRAGVTKGRKLGAKQTIELPYLRVANVQDGYLNLKEIKTIEVLPSDLDKYKLIDGDILFTEGGDRDKLGRGTIWNNEIPNCIHQNHIIRARVDVKSLNPAYISYFTKTKVALDYFYNNANQTINLASISLTTLSNVPIALPPFEEQNEIARRIQAIFKLVGAVESRYKRATEYLNGTKKTVYQKAFSGQFIEPKEKIGSNFRELVAKEKAEVLTSSKESSLKTKGLRKLKKENVMEIIEALINNGGAMKSVDLWKATRYADSIEEFYSALKVEMEEKKSIKENIDKSILQLSNYEN